MKPLPPRIEETLLGDEIFLGGDGRLAFGEPAARRDGDSPAGSRPPGASIEPPTRLAIEWEGYTFTERDPATWATLATGSVVAHEIAGGAA